MREERGIDDVTVIVKADNSPYFEPSVGVEFQDDDYEEGLHGSLGLSLEDIDWLITYLTVARNCTWPVDTNPDRPNQLALISSLVSADRDEELLRLRMFAKASREQARKAHEQAWAVEKTLTELQNAAAAVIVDAKAEHKQWLAYEMTRLSALVNERKIQRGYEDYLKAVTAAKLDEVPA